MAKAKKQKAGKLSIADMRKIVNKKAGENVAHDLAGSNPTEVKEWIPTGSRWLDSIICKGRLAGIPVGNQSVLLKGVNDNLKCLEELSERLFCSGVIPYYIHILDEIEGAERFAVTLQKARELRLRLTNKLPNYLVPKFVREMPGGKSKEQI